MIDDGRRHRRETFSACWQSYRVYVQMIPHIYVPIEPSHASVVLKPANGWEQSHGKGVAGSTCPCAE